MAWLNAKLNRGAWVRTVSEAEAAEMLEVRAVLEGLAARYAARNATARRDRGAPRIHAQMQACWNQAILLGNSELNAQWHDKLLAMARHQTVTALILYSLRAQYFRFQYRTLLVPGWFRRFVGRTSSGDRRGGCA